MKPDPEKKIPFVDLPSQWEEIKNEAEPAILSILRSGGFIGGPEVDNFEKEFAAYLGVEHCVALSSGTAALHFVLRAMGIGEGDEVITSANTFIATAEAIALAGAAPVLVDIEADGINPTADAFINAVTPRTKAIMPVHLFGFPADLREVRSFAASKGIKIIEDACQAHGARSFGKLAGTLGDAGAFSFYPGKNLGAFGDAGAVVTDDREVAEHLKMLRNHGLARRYDHRIVGSTERMDAIQAAGLRAKLKRLDAWNNRRRGLAARYVKALSGLDNLWLPEEKAGQESCYHLFVIRHEKRDDILAALSEANIEAGMHYPVPVHLSAAFSRLGKSAGSFPNAEKACATGVSLPMSPHLTDAQQDRVINVVRKSLGA